jgi:hypothetical protein
VCGFPVYNEPHVFVGTEQEKEPDTCDMVRDQVLDITPTFLTSNMLSTLGKVDHVVIQVSKSELRDTDYGVWHKI